MQNIEWLTPEIVQILRSGLVLTICLGIITSIAALVIGVLVGILRLRRKTFLSSLAGFYIEVHRNIPALVLIIFWAFALPNIFPVDLRKSIFFDNPFINQFGQVTGLSIPYYTLAAAFAITFNTSAYLAEIFRAGVGTIQQEHLDAARTLGASRAYQLKQILIPQGIRAAFPAISTRLIHNHKNTALAAFVSTPELFHSINTSITRSFRAMELLLIASLIYLLTSLIYAALLRWIDGRLNRNLSVMNI
jgi:polar amino acid transport system permease protein